MDKTAEMIKCPACDIVQAAIFEHTVPFGTYVHECVKCKYVIMESEWQSVNPFKQSPSGSEAAQAEWEFLTIIRANRDILKNAEGKVAFPNHSPKSAALEVYDDMIEIISNLPVKRSGKEKEVINCINNLSSTPPVEEKACEHKNTRRIFETHECVDCGELINP